MRAISKTQTYSIPQELQFSLREKDVRVWTKQGISDWNRLTPASALLASHTQVAGAERLLVLGVMHGAAGLAIARDLKSGEAWFHDQNYLSLQMLDKTLQTGESAPVHILETVDLPENSRGNFDTVVMEAPKGRQLSQRWLLMAYEALRPKGSFYLAGAKDQGIQAVIHNSESLFGPGTILGYQKGNRVARFIKPDNRNNPSDLPDWAKQPGIQRGTWKEILIGIPSLQIRAGMQWKLVSLPGVFSSDGLDEGTRLLLDNLPQAGAGTALDLGCGYGVIGISLAHIGYAKVDLVDANLYAVASAQENLLRQGISSARALPSDVLSAVSGEKYDRILTNPPFHTGKAVEYAVAEAFIRQSAEGLNPGGQLWVVANRFIRYEQILSQVFRRVEIAAETGKFRVLVGMQLLR
jgi:16S rRNA (guanine1207-N2)-methyltransferase